MATVLGRLTINIDGSTSATDLSIVKDFDTTLLGNGKVEYRPYFKNTNSPATLTFTKNGLLSKLIIVSSISTELITCTFHINDGVNPAYTIVIPFMDFAVWNFGSTFFGYITSIDFATVSTAYLELDIRAYV